MIPAFRALGIWCDKHKLPRPTVTLSFDSEKECYEAAWHLWRDIGPLTTSTNEANVVRDGTLYGIAFRLTYEGG
jgi:hypothetical protein